MHAHRLARGAKRRLHRGGSRFERCVTPRHLLFTHPPRMDAPLPAEFQAAADAVARLRTPTTDEQKLQFYALYKQATQGACTGPRPGFFDFVGKAKWSAAGAPCRLGGLMSSQGRMERAGQPESC